MYIRSELDGGHVCGKSGSINPERNGIAVTDTVYVGQLITGDTVCIESISLYAADINLVFVNQINRSGTLLCRTNGVTVICLIKGVVVGVILGNLYQITNLLCGILRGIVLPCGFLFATAGKGCSNKGGAEKNAEHFLFHVFSPHKINLQMHLQLLHILQYLPRKEHHIRSCRSKRALLPHDNSLPARLLPKRSRQPSPDRCQPGHEYRYC